MALFTQDQPISSSVANEDAPAQMAFLQKVYSVFLLGLVAALGGVVVVFSNPSLIQLIASHPWITIIAEFAVFFLAIGVRKTPGINVVALLAFTFVNGAVLSPYLLMVAAQTGGTFAVVYQALGLTVSIFLGLTVYTFVSKKDFSFLGPIVSIGLISVIVIMLLNFFFKSSAADLAIAWVSSILFSLFVLYDTSRIMRTHESDEYVSGALSLYLDFINLFLAILRILSGGRRN